MADAIITNTVAVIPDLTVSGGGGGAPTDATYWTGSANGSLSAEHNLGALSTGLVKNTSGTPSTAVAGTDYQAPLAAGTDYEVPLTFTGGLTRTVNSVAITTSLTIITQSDHTATLPASRRLVAGTNVTFDTSVAGQFSIAASGGVTDHGALTGLADDDHTQYVLLAGRSGGQTLIGGTAASNNLVLQSTSNGTRGVVQVVDDLNVTRSSTGLVVGLVSNTSNTGSANATFSATVAGTSAGDPEMLFTVTGGSTWRVGLDNSDSDTFKIHSSAFGSNNCFTLTTDGLVGFARQESSSTSGIATFGTLTGAHGAFGYDHTNALFRFSAQTGKGLSILVDASSERFRITSGGNIAVFTGSGSYGGGALVMFLANATTVPTTNPSGGGILYAEGGALKWRGSSGTVTTMGPA